MWSVARRRAFTPSRCRLRRPTSTTPAGSGTVTIDQTSTSATNTPYSVSVTASPTSVPANGTSATITATVLNASGSPVGGDTVAFSEPSSAPASCGTINGGATATAVTNSSGQATVTYTASTTTGSCTITAVESADGQSGSVTITQTTPPNTVTVQAASGSSLTVPANGTTSESL
ncbi:Ig-like domain-containing protein, partial [Aciditerrimonas ferrireducens]